MADDSEVQCLTNPFKPIQPGIVKIERQPPPDEIQILSSKSSASSSSTHVSPSANGPTTSLATALSNALARRSVTPPDGSGADLEEIRMLRTLLQRATDKNKNLKLQKEKILLKRKILAVERENNALKDEIGGLEKQPLATPPQNQLQRSSAHSGVRVPAAQLPLRLNNSYNLHRQSQAAKVAQVQQHIQQQQNPHMRPSSAQQSALINKHYQNHPQQVSRYQNPAAAALAHRLQNPHQWSSQNRQFPGQHMQKPLNHLPSTTQQYYNPQQPLAAAVAQQAAVAQHQAVQQAAVAQQQHQQHQQSQQAAAHLVQQHNAPAAHQVNRLQHVPAVTPRHPNPASSNHATLAAVSKILNGSSLTGIATSLSTAASNLSNAHNTLLNNHAGIHSNTPRLVQNRALPQQQALSNTVEVNLLKSTNHVGREGQPINRVNEQQINELIKSALQKESALRSYTSVCPGGYENLLTQMQMMARAPTNTPVVSSCVTSSAAESVASNTLDTNTTLNSAVSTDIIATSTADGTGSTMEVEGDSSSGLANSTVQISVGNEDVDVDIGIPDNDNDNDNSMDYTSGYNDQNNNDDLATFTELFALSDDPLNLTSPNDDNITSSNGTGSAESDGPQQPYDLSKLDTATLKQLLSSVCSFCSGDVTANKMGEPEELLTCCDCSLSGHPSCLQFSVELTEKVKTYAWQCIECKTCVLCGELGDDNKLMFCDECDKGFHTDCLSPALAEVPEGNWSCNFCKGISVPATDNVSKSNSNLRDILLQKANKVINQATNERTPAEMMQKTEEIIASLLASGRKRTKSSESHRDAPSSKRQLHDI